MMKKLFSGGGNDKSNWLGKVLHVGKHQCLIEEIIAEGGFALVFHVKSSLGQRYALKRVSVNELEGLEMCKQEIMILKKLSGHKNTILFVDSAVNVLSPGIYEVLILMEYCKAGHVIQLMNECLQTGFTEKMVMKIFCDVCEALALLHAHQPAIIHRDLKVENVLRKQSGDFVLCDYGSAYMGEMDPEVEGVQKVEEDIATCTTLPYRSPEMVDLYSGLKITTKSDIWALGCLLYKLCFFTTPFGESTLAIQNGQFSFPETSRFSDDLYLLIKMMLVVDQEKRPDIFHVANFAFRMTGKPCPVRNYKPKAQQAHAQLKPVETRGQNAGRMNRSASPLMPRAAQVSLDNADASDQKNNMAQQSREPVSTSLAPRQRPKGVNKFSSANDVATPTPFKNEQGDHHPQPGQRQLQQHVSQQQRVQVQQQAQYQQQQYQQKLLQQQQHQFQQLKQQQQQHFQQQQLKHQQQQLNQQQQQQRQQQQQQFQQQQQLQQQLYYQQMQDRQRMVQQRQTEQQQKLAFEQQQQQKLAFEQQQQQLALEQQRQYQQQLSAENVNALPILNLGPTQIDGQPPVNPFEDNFAAGHSDDVFSNSQANNPFQTAQFSVSQVPNAENRAANYRSHFRSRSDTFSDLARRVNSSEDDTDSNAGFLKPVGDTNSPNKSVPDMRVVGNADPSSKNTPEVEFQNHSKTNDCATPIETEQVETLSRPDRLQLQQQQQKEQPPKQHVTQKPKQQPNPAIFNLPLLPLDQCQSRSQAKIHNGANSVDLRLSHSEPAFNTSSNRNIEAGKQTSEGVKEKMNIPTLAEADAFPLISPSSSVQERQYVYRRTSSCSSEELEKSLSESSEESSIEDEVDGDEDRVNYLKIISSSTSSLEEDADAMAPDHPRSKTEKHIENQASSSAAKDSNEEVHEDVFGSAPFCMNSLKISITKKPKKPSSTLRSDEKKSSGCLSAGRNKAFVDNRPSQNEKGTGSQESQAKAKANEPITSGNPFSDSDPFTLHGARPSCSNGTRAKEHQKDNDFQDPFGSAPFVKVVRHKKPLSSEQLASQSHRHGRVQARRRMLPKAPIQE